MSKPTPDNADEQQQQQQQLAEWFAYYIEGMRGCLRLILDDGIAPETIRQRLNQLRNAADYN